MLIAAALLATTTLGQPDNATLVIYPRVPGLTYEDLRTRDDGTVVAAYIPPRPDGAMDIDAAISLFPGAPFVEIEEGVTWEIVWGDTDVATINHLGEIFFTAPGRIRVRARFGDLVSEPMPVQKSILPSKMGPWDEEEPEGGPRSPVPPNDQLKSTVQNSVDFLRQRYGLSSNFGLAASNTRIQTNSGTGWIGWGSFLGSSDAAAAYTNRLRETPGGGAYASGPLIVVADSVASEIVANGMTDANGMLTDAGQAVVHELLHAVLDRLGIEMSEALEELLAHTFGELTANKLFDLQKKLENARNGATPQEQRNIENLIKSIMADVRTIRAGATTIKDKAALEDALTILDLDDRDGDGIPNYVEDMIERMFQPDGPPQWIIDMLERLSGMQDAGDPLPT